MLDLVEHGDCMGGDFESKWNDRELVVVGIGPSGKPSATPTIMVSRLETETTDMFDKPKTKTLVDIALELAWAKDGTLTVKGKTKGGDASVLGTHTLAFP